MRLPQIIHGDFPYLYVCIYIYIVNINFEVPPFQETSIYIYIHIRIHSFPIHDLKYKTNMCSYFMILKGISELAMFDCQRVYSDFTVMYTLWQSKHIYGTCRIIPISNWLVTIVISHLYIDGFCHSNKPCSRWDNTGYFENYWGLPRPIRNYSEWMFAPFFVVGKPRMWRRQWHQWVSLHLYIYICIYTRICTCSCYFLVSQHCYWQWPFIVDLPVKHGDFNHSYLSLPEGERKKYDQHSGFLWWFWGMWQTRRSFIHKSQREFWGERYRVPGNWKNHPISIHIHLCLAFSKNEYLDISTTLQPVTPNVFRMGFGRTLFFRSIESACSQHDDTGMDG